MRTARIVRGLVLSLKEKEFVEAGRALGASDWRIIFRHLSRTASARSSCTPRFTVAAAILTESTLSFLGFGVQPPHADWGNLLADCKAYVGQARAWLVCFPSLTAVLTVLWPSTSWATVCATPSTPSRAEAHERGR